MAEQHGLDSDQRATRRRRQAEGATSKPSNALHPLLRLQSHVGNAQVARMLAQRQSEEEDAIQREPEEDDTLQREPEEDDNLQRESDEEDELHRAISDSSDAQREVGPAGGSLSPGTAAQVRALQGGGAPLAGPIRQQMEGAFGDNFEDVRVHTGPTAGQLNRAMSARAFTVGNDIVLGPQASPNDSRTLAHELTHVVQQRSMDPSGGGLKVGAADDQHEQQADAVARDVASGAQPEAERD